MAPVINLCSSHNLSLSRIISFIMLNGMASVRLTLLSNTFKFLHWNTRGHTLYSHVYNNRHQHEHCLYSKRDIRHVNNKVRLWRYTGGGLVRDFFVFTIIITYYIIWTILYAISAWSYNPEMGLSQRWNGVGEDLYAMHIVMAWQTITITSIGAGLMLKGTMVRMRTHTLNAFVPYVYFIYIIPRIKNLFVNEEEISTSIKGKALTKRLFSSAI